MANSRVFISSTTFTSTQVFPVWNGAFTHEKERDQVFYRKKVAGDMVFMNSDFSLIASVDECVPIEVIIEKFCAGIWEVAWRGIFTKFDCKFDIDRCEIRVNPKTDDEYKCFLSNYNDEWNIFNVSAYIQTKAFKGVYEAGICSTCCQSVSGPPPCDPTSKLDEYCLEYNDTISDEICGGIITTCFHRIVGVATPTTPPPFNSGWSHISGNNWWRCPGTTEINIGVLSYGRLFNSAINHLVLQADCSLTLRSHFLGINATHDAAPLNIAYEYAAKYLQNMTIHQKSDVKRPDATNQAYSWVWVMKLKDLLDDLRIMFNLRWVIVGHDLILEHVTYFTSSAGFNYSEIKNPKQYQQDSDGAPQKETYKWSDEAAFSIDHAGYPITYTCGEGEREHKVKLFSNDIYAIKSSENSEDISDKNYVLISNSIIEGEYIINDNNNPVGFKMLHNNLHRHDRFFIEGSMNDITTSFITARKSRKMKKFTVPICCGDQFDPTKFIITSIGDGDVAKATENIIRETLELELVL